MGRVGERDHIELNPKRVRACCSKTAGYGAQSVTEGGFVAVVVVAVVVVAVVVVVDYLQIGSRKQQLSADGRSPN